MTAATTGKMRTDFILEAARCAADETLLGRALTVVSPEACATFLERLDQPAQPNQRLQKTMRGQTPWRCLSDAAPTGALERQPRSGRARLRGGFARTQSAHIRRAVKMARKI